MNSIEKASATAILTSILIVASIAGSSLINAQKHPMMSVEGMDMQRDSFIGQKGSMTEFLIDHHLYRCCLAQPCGYCIEKTPEHGEGATCNCLEDVVLGKHPCGECIGEILEGHGNPLLAEYFARAIAEEVGETHRDMLKQIIQEKYGIPIEDQL